MQTYLPKLMDNPCRERRANDPRPAQHQPGAAALLAGIPGLPPTAVDQIIANRDVTLGQQRPEQMYETWLLQDGIVDLEEMKKLMALVTTRRQRVPGPSRGVFRRGRPGRPAGSGDRRHQNAARRPPPLGAARARPGYSPEVLGVPARTTPLNRLCTMKLVGRTMTDSASPTTADNSHLL